MLEVNQRIQYVSGHFYYSEDTRTTTKTSVRKERERVVCIDVDVCVCCMALRPLITVESLMHSVHNLSELYLHSEGEVVSLAEYLCADSLGFTSHLHNP